MIRHAASLLPALLLATLAACTTAEAPARDAIDRPSGRPEARLARARSVVADIEGRLMAFRRVEGTWRVGETAGGFAAFLDAGRPARIDERLEDEDGVHSRLRYYFDGPSLVYCTKDADDVALSVFFDATGDVIQADKRVGDRSDLVTTSEIRTILRHAEQLRLQAEGLGDVR
jgi:L-rhamnose isomerase